MTETDANHGLQCPITGETEDLVLLSQSLSKETPLVDPRQYQAHAFHESVTLAEIKDWEEQQEDSLGQVKA